jgi:hypothetical protein
MLKVNTGALLGNAWACLSQLKMFIDHTKAKILQGRNLCAGERAE